MADTDTSALEKKKAALIERMLELQDQADRTNEQIYRLTVEIEQLNVRIGRSKVAEPRSAK